MKRGVDGRPTYTLGEIVDAMERDITPKAIGYLSGVHGERCVIGGAAYVLDVDAGALWRGLCDLTLCPRLPSAGDEAFLGPMSLGRQIANLNDYSRRSKKQIAKAIRKATCDLTAEVRLIQ